MFFLRSSSTLTKSNIQRLEPILTVPSNTPSSRQDDLDFQETPCSSDEPQNLSPPIQISRQNTEDVRIIFRKTRGDMMSFQKKRAVGEEESEIKVETRVADASVHVSRRAPTKHLRTTNNRSSFKNTHKHTSKSFYKKCEQKHSNEKTVEATRNYTQKCSVRYEKIKSKVDSGMRKIISCPMEDGNENNCQCLAIQTSNHCQNGSGDAVSHARSNLSKDESKILERFRRINMKIIEEVSKTQSNCSNQILSTDTDDDDSDLESLEELEKEAAEEELAQKLNQDALEACLFLNQNYPNYFQHLIIRYQLNVPTTDQRELDMRKIDLSRIAAESEERLEYLETMYKKRAVLNPVAIFCDIS